MTFGWPRRLARRVTAAILLPCSLVVGGCATQIDLPKHLMPLPTAALAELQDRKLRADQPIYVRIFKEESDLEVWKLGEDGRYRHFRTYPICTWSGALGPKIMEGDKQSPEGFYSVPREQMNPHSKFHLAFNLGFPNAYDRSHNRTGTALMVHGKCTSAGCYAITDAYVEEVYALAREAFIGGQAAVPVHIFPFRMTEANFARHGASANIPFWLTLKPAYDFFEATRTTPDIAVCDRGYVVNPIWRAPLVKALDANRACPSYVIAPLPSPDVTPPITRDTDLRVLPGRRLRTLASAPG